MKLLEYDILIQTDIVALEYISTLLFKHDPLNSFSTRMSKVKNK